MLIVIGKSFAMDLSCYFVILTVLNANAVTFNNKNSEMTALFHWSTKILI